MGVPTAAQQLNVVAERKAKKATRVITSSYEKEDHS
jgi:hypothetical protein